MKIHHTIALLALMAVPNVAFAECPSSSGLAQVDAILDYCAQVDPALASNASAFKRLLTQGTSVGELDKIIDGKDYQHVYSETREALTKLPKSLVIASCSDTLGGKK